MNKLENLSKYSVDLDLSRITGGVGGKTKDATHAVNSTHSAEGCTDEKHFYDTDDTVNRTCTYYECP
ncbi:MAG: hypothetical protein R2799_03655 [Crocinitomicaceae bacterium]